MALTVLTPGADAEVDAELVGDLVLVAPTSLQAALGWELRPEGLCRDAVCVPIRDDSAIRHGDRIDLIAAAGALGSTTLLVDEADILAVGVPADARRAALVGRQAPDFTLSDLDGASHSLEAYRDLKRLLVAFASW